MIYISRYARLCCSCYKDITPIDILIVVSEQQVVFHHFQFCHLYIYKFILSWAYFIFLNHIFFCVMAISALTPLFKCFLSQILPSFVSGFQPFPYWLIILLYSFKIFVMGACVVCAVHMLGISSQSPNLDFHLVYDASCD